MKLSVTYSKKNQYEGYVELDDGDLMAEFQDELRDLSDVDVRGGELTVTLTIDIENMVTDQIENGYVEDEELTAEGDVEDIDIGGVA